MPVTIAPGATLAEAERVFEKRDFNGLPVVGAGGELVGFLTKLDVLRAFRFTEAHLASCEAREWRAQAHAGMTTVRRLALALGGLAVVTALGTLGFVWIEGWPWFDALYMTVTTITTVGYREVGPLSTGGRAFVIALIALGVGTTLYLLTALAALVLEGQLRTAWQRNAMQRRIDSLGSHVIVCGYGRYGRVVVEELVHANADLVVVEVDPALDSDLAQAGVGAKPSTWRRSGWRPARPGGGGGWRRWRPRRRGCSSWRSSAARSRSASRPISPRFSRTAITWS